MNVVKEIEKQYMKEKVPSFSIGDTLRVYVKIKEGDKERVQPFVGQLIAERGTGINKSITLRRISFGEGVERVFLLHSPNISKIDVVKHRPARRAKLYYLRKGSSRK
jgi:large subunit ribosomal protein L19